MFLIIGITEGRKDFDFSQMVICDSCGAYGRYIVYMTYTVLNLFFIPTFRWNKKYFVQMSCCGTVYELDPAIGGAIARGNRIEIRKDHLSRVSSSSTYRKICRNCGFSTEEDFEFCPKCGRRF